VLSEIALNRNDLPVKVLSENQTWLATEQITVEFQILAGKYFKRDARIVPASTKIQQKGVGYEPCTLQ
jgi:hypothetical protein